MGKQKKTKVVITYGESICKTPEERERLFRFFQLLYEIDKRINATGNWPKKDTKTDITKKIIETK